MILLKNVKKNIFNHLNLIVYMENIEEVVSQHSYSKTMFFYIMFDICQRRTFPNSMFT